MPDFNNREKIIQLFRIYENMLTDKQRKIFNFYFIEDLSLREVSELTDISRAAVHDSLTKSQNILLKYEKKLKIYQKQILRYEVYYEFHLNKNKKFWNKIIDIE